MKTLSKRLTKVLKKIFLAQPKRSESSIQLGQSKKTPPAVKNSSKTKKKNNRLVEKSDVLDAVFAYQEPIFHVRTADCLSRAGISYRSESAEHPFVLSLQDFAQHRTSDRIHPILKRWFSQWQPTRFEELFGTSPGSELATINPNSNRIEFRLPWESNDKISHLTPMYGPVSDDTIDREVQRLINVFLSIGQHGYQPEEFGNDIRGLLLISDQHRYRFIVKGGQHRVAALVALGHEAIRVRFQPGWPRMIVRHEVEHWPQVRSASITANDAIKIFDAFMNR